jgi:hypothetical protein
MGTVTGRGALVNRIRERQRRAGPLAARPIFPPARPKMHAADRLAVLLDVCGLNDRQAACLRMRLAGLPVREVAARLGVSKPRAVEVEDQSLARLGLRGDSMDRILYGDARPEARPDGGERDGMHAVNGGKSDRWRERWVRDHEKRVVAFLRANG